jgi:hypothetical protein
MCPERCLVDVVGMHEDLMVAEPYIELLEE